MTDLEITKRCAVAMGYEERDDSGDAFCFNQLTQKFDVPDGLCVFDKTSPPIQQIFYFNPLYDDAQALALVKKLRLRIVEPSEITNGGWLCLFDADTHGTKQHFTGESDNLNRAICECVAKMRG